MGEHTGGAVRGFVLNVPIRAITGVESPVRERADRGEQPIPWPPTPRDRGAGMPCPPRAAAVPVTHASVRCSTGWWPDRLFAQPVGPGASVPTRVRDQAPCTVVSHPHGLRHVRPELLTMSVSKTSRWVPPCNCRPRCPARSPPTEDPRCQNVFIPRNDAARDPACRGCR